MKIFRYYKAEYALLVLIELEIRTSVPNGLNDPFELSPNIDADGISKRRAEWLLRGDRSIDKFYKEEGRRLGFTNKKRYKDWYLKDIPRRAAELHPNFSKNAEAIRQSFADRFSQYWRVICASKIPDSILMWSHYADNHGGLVIEFETDEAPFNHIGADSIREIIYSDKKAHYRQFKDLRRFQNEMFTVATTKAREWAYEQEVRILIAADPAILRETRYLTLSPNCVQGVYLGCRSSEALKTSVRNALQRPNLAHIQLSQAQLSPSEYALTFLQAEK